ncbi:MAG: outer membrane protein assembly factor BamD [Paludibacteraceae bacterium]|nr:outer membrane protein assembly factor BamD [Paludibacteraceae bacterium]
MDQEITRNAIEAFTSFVELYPNSPYSEQAYQEMNEMYDKLAYKEYLSAKLYYNLGTYLGNNYASCEITAKNALRDYPSNKHQEELSWLVFMAKYQQMVNSFEEKRVDRARDTQDEYYSFITDYPDSKHRAQANKIYKEIEKILQKVD